MVCRRLLLVIIQVFVAQSKAVDPLRQHFSNRVFDQCPIPAVQKTLGKTCQRVESLVDLA